MTTAPGRTLRVAGMLLPLCLVPVVSACKATGGREVVVQFDLDPTTHLPDPAAVAAARADCPGNANAVLQPAPTSTLLSVQQHPVRYDANKADDRTVSELLRCLQAVPGVKTAGLAETDT